MRFFPDKSNSDWFRSARTAHVQCAREGAHWCGRGNRASVALMEKGPTPATARETAGFTLLLISVTAAMIWSLWAFSGAILWAIVLAVVFSPLKERVQRGMPGRDGLATTITLLIIVCGVLFPVSLLINMLIGEAAGLVARLQSNPAELPALFDRIVHALPDWAQSWLHQSGWDNLSTLGDRLAANIQTLAQALGAKALSIGADLLSYLVALLVALYLIYVFLRHGRMLVERAGAVVPLAPQRRAVLANNFISVVRATVKGSIVVSVAQGTAGGVIMWLLGVPNALLWAVVMAFSSLLPAVGTGLVWVPASLYLLATGHIWQGIVMALMGAFVIGTIDNVLRPILVGRETQMPDALVLLVTLGGLSAFGFNGLIIGPVIASLFLATWEMVREDQRA